VRDAFKEELPVEEISLPGRYAVGESNVKVMQTTKQVVNAFKRRIKQGECVEVERSNDKSYYTWRTHEYSLRSINPKWAELNDREIEAFKDPNKELTLLMINHRAERLQEVLIPLFQIAGLEVKSVDDGRLYGWGKNKALRFTGPVVDITITVKGD